MLVGCSALHIGSKGSLFSRGGLPFNVTVPVTSPVGTICTTTGTGSSAGTVCNDGLLTSVEGAASRSELALASAGGGAGGRAAWGFFVVTVDLDFSSRV